MAQKLVEKHAEKIKLFEECIKSKVTKKLYIFYLRKYMDHIGSKFNSLLEDEDPKKIEQSIIDYIILLKKTKSYAAVHNYVSPVIAFYKINDIILNVDKIARFMPEQRKSKKDREYKHEEISKVLEFADERMRTIILLLASTGMRIGAIPSLRLSNLEKFEIEIENSKIYKITVYENDKEEYFTFCTSECAKAIDEYLEMRSRYGEKINGDTPLIREQFDIRDPFAISRPVKILSKTLTTKLTELAIRSGLRKKQILTLEENEKHLGSSFRKDVMIAHGFRKFFTTQLVNSKVNPEIREMLLGHTIGLTSCYYKPSLDDFIIEFQKAVNNLTINEEYKLRMKVRKLEIEKSQLEKLAADVAILKRKWKIR
jgi:integrase